MHKTHQEHFQSELSMKGENMFFFFCYLKAITWINSVSIWNRNKHITSVSISQSEKYNLCTKKAYSGFLLNFSYSSGEYLFRLSNNMEHKQAVLEHFNQIPKHTKKLQKAPQE